MVSYGHTYKGPCLLVDFLAGDFSDLLFQALWVRPLSASSFFPHCVYFENKNQMFVYKQTENVPYKV